MKEKIEKDPINSPEEDNINKIRDILFGNNISEIDKKFQEIEAIVRQRNDKLSDEIKSNITHLQEHFQTEVNNLVDQLKNEREENKKAFEGLLTKHEKQITEFKEYKNEIQETHREIRKNQLDQFNQLGVKLDETSKEINNTIEENTRKLTDTKVDRKALAMLFSELALKLSDNDITT